MTLFWWNSSNTTESSIKNSKCWLSKRKTWAWKAEGTTYLCTEMIPLAFNSFILRPRCHRPTPLIPWTLQTPQLLQYLGCFEELNLIMSWPQEELFHFFLWPDIKIFLSQRLGSCRHINIFWIYFTRSFAHINKIQGFVLLSPIQFNLFTIRKRYVFFFEAKGRYLRGCVFCKK